MTTLHGDHVGDVLHHDYFGLETAHDPDELLVECIAWVIQVPRANLAEALAWRPAIDHVHAFAEQLLDFRHPSLFLNQKATDVAPKQWHAREIGGVGRAGMVVSLNAA